MPDALFPRLLRSERVRAECPKTVLRSGNSIHWRCRILLRGCPAVQLDQPRIRMGRVRAPVLPCVQSDEHPSNSAERIAKIYNSSMHLSTSFLAELSAEVIVDAFFLSALLRWTAQQGIILRAPHHGPQSSRFDAAMHQRNVYMAGTGQDQWSHACTGCMKVKQDEQGRNCKCRSLAATGLNSFQTESLPASWMAFASVMRAVRLRTPTGFLAETR